MRRAKPELLAPAGTAEAFLAALEAGADAVYVGLPTWSARARARNVPLDELARLLPVAHAGGQRVYVTLNTILREEEVPVAAEAIAELAALGVDALIVQDLGVAAVARAVAPELRLHASTQMTVHNAAGVRALAALGFARVVVSRECTVDELRAIVRTGGLPIEVFVHGALCYSLSGQCLASSVLTGRSANRGQCAQICRWGFATPDGETGCHPFSPSDLSLVARVRDLAGAGVSALKIEGRLKGADYVDAVVRAYRRVLEAEGADVPAALREAQALLAGVEQRPTTEGYVRAARPEQVLADAGRAAVGRPIGRVVSWRDGTATLLLERRPHRGDRLRLQGAGGESRKAFVIREFRTSPVRGGFELVVEDLPRAAPGDLVLVVKEADGEALEQRLRKHLGTLPPTPGRPVSLRVALDGTTLRVAARTGDAATSLSFEVTTHAAERHPLDAETLARHLGRITGGGYRLDALEVDGDLPPVVVPPSEFRAVREALVAALDSARTVATADRRARVAALRAPASEPPADDDARALPRLWLRLDTRTETCPALDEAPHRVVAPLVERRFAARAALAASLGGPERVVFELPVWLEERELPSARRALEQLAAEGFEELVLTNVSQLDLVRGLPFRLHAGRELHALNGWAAAALARCGFATFVPSPEADRTALEALAAGGWPLRPVVLVYGRLPLLTTRLDPGVLVPEDAPARAATGTVLSWRETGGLGGAGHARVYGDLPLAWTTRLPALQALGVADVLVSLEASDVDPRALVAAVRRAEAVSGTTEANWSRGLS